MPKSVIKPAREAYPSKEALAEGVVRILREEAQELAAAGADFIQFDEPVLTEVVFAPKAARTSCAPRWRTAGTRRRSWSLRWA
jgi:methionine synthase II (cobalamin-independent)